MLKNFVIIAWRNLLRNKLHSLINVAGLCIGIAACLVIYLIVSHEFSFNKGFAGYDKIYRIHSSFSGLFSGLNRGVPTATAGVVDKDFTGLTAVAPIHVYTSKIQIPGKPEKKEIEKREGVVIASSEFFKVFDAYEWLAGSASGLDEPFQVVLTKSRANLYFGPGEASSFIGREVIYRDSLSVSVAGIVNDLPFNSDIDFHDFISFPTIEKSWIGKNILLDDWTSVNSSSQLFVRLDDATPPAQLEAQLPILAKAYKDKSSFDAENKFTIQPLSDLHFGTSTGIFDYSRTPAHLPTLTTLIIVAFLLIIIGAINFINLETAIALRRAKEVGVRKVMGSTQSTLVLQFLFESLGITLVAVLLALPLTEFALYYFKEFMPSGVTLDIVKLLPALGIILVVVSFFAGLYPAFVLSSFLPVVALKNQFSIAGRNASSVMLRKSLIVFQFTIAQVLIIATLIVGTQINFMLTKDLGFKRDAIVYFDVPWREPIEKATVLKNELNNLSSVASISRSSDTPTAEGWSSSIITYTDKEEIKLSAYRKFGDPAYLPMYGIQLLAGRNVSASDTIKELIINETMMKQLGIRNPQEAIGKEIEYSQVKVPIVGVVKDFHIQSLHNKVEPVMIGDESGNFTCFNIQLKNTDDHRLGESMAAIEKAWKKVYPESTLDIKFLDDTVRNLYETEMRTSKLSSTAMMLAIFISCLGLFGLASFTSNQRTKEIGIRKVLGATAQSIVLLLSKDFIFLVLLAFALAAPIAWVGGNLWLQDFAYHTTISYWLFIVTALSAVLLAFATVSYKTLKAAHHNPVESLRSE